MRYRYQYLDQIYEVSLERNDFGYRATVNGKPYEFEVLKAQPGELSLRFAGRPLTLYWAADGNQKWVSLEGCTYRLQKPSTRSPRHAGEHSAEITVRAPMPAQVMQVQISPNDLVQKGQTLLLLEAMKMEIRIQAPRQGRVVRLSVSEGQSVERDQVLIEIEDVESAP